MVDLQDDTSAVNLPVSQEERPPLRLGVLISGNGFNCAAIARAIQEGRLTGCEIAVVVCNVTGAPGVERARQMGLTVITLEGRGREQRDHEEAIQALLRKYRVEMVCLAGYRRVLSARFVRQWKGRMLNIHPSLLPAFPGFNAPQQALEYGVHITGCTVHFVEEWVDAGAIVLQRSVEVLDTDTEDTLKARLREIEQQAYPEAIARVLSGEYEAVGRRYIKLGYAPEPERSREQETPEEVNETVQAGEQA